MARYMHRPDRVDSHIAGAGLPGGSLEALFSAPVGGRWKVSLKIYPFVEDTHDFDHAVWCCPIHQEVTSAAPPPRNVERAKTCHDLVPGLGAYDIWAVGEFTDRVDERVPINTRLTRAKILSGPFEDVGEVDFCGRAESNLPSPLGHETLFGCSGDNLLREVIQIGLQLLDIPKLSEFS